jgi:hypothetical protein
MTLAVAEVEQVEQVAQVEVHRLAVLVVLELQTQLLVHQ